MNRTHLQRYLLGTAIAWAALACVPVRAPLPDATATVDAAGAADTSAPAPDTHMADTHLADTSAPDAPPPDVQTPDSSAPEDALSDGAAAPEDATATNAGADIGTSSDTGADTTTADVALPDAGPTSDATANDDATADDVQASTCSSGPDATATDAPQPDSYTCSAPPPKFFAGGPVPSPTLKVEIGTHVPQVGDFAPYQPDQWLPIVHGPQGGFHVFVALRVTLPGVTDANVKMQGEISGYGGCALWAHDQQPVFYVKPDKLAGTYTNAGPYSPGTLLIFSGSSAESKLYCDKWLRIVARARRVGTDQWGEATLMVRLYDQL